MQQIYFHGQKKFNTEFTRLYSEFSVFLALLAKIGLIRSDKHSNLFQWELNTAVKGFVGLFNVSSWNQNSDSPSHVCTIL